MSYDVTQVKELIKRAKNKRKYAKTLTQEAIELENEAMQLCNHSIIEKKSDYFDGSYCDKAHTIHRTYCAICGKLLNKEREEHSWYG